MESLGIGKIIETEQHRDAVHMAIVPVVAHDHLSPGQHVGVKEGHSCSADPIGIVDPFLWSTVQARDKFWLFLYPGSITSLRHEWTHPAFEFKESPISDEEKRRLVTLLNASRIAVSGGYGISAHKGIVLTMNH